MRKCTIHGTELNCAANVIGGQCGGTIQGSEVVFDPPPDVDFPVDPTEEAEVNARLGMPPMMEHAETYDDAVKLLCAKGLTEDDARAMLDAPGSPFHKADADNG